MSKPYPLQPIIDIAEICALKGVEYAILCPGSRCAPLVIAFNRQSVIRCLSISDERTAAFIGLGIAQSTQKPVVLVCTSGTAALNFYPAITEAYYQHIPLIILTADRPPEWIDQLDGQTIRQQNIYANHIKKSYHLPHDYTHPDSRWHINRTINEGINLATAFPSAPVHINVPLREPFYPKPDEIIQTGQKVRIFSELPLHPTSYQIPDEIIHAWKNTTRKLLVCGQMLPNALPQNLLDKLPCLTVADSIANVRSHKAIYRQDAFLNDRLHENPALQPDLLITIGNSLISKNLKLFLRKAKAIHWHIQPEGEVADTFKSLHTVIRAKPDIFLHQLTSIPTNQDTAFENSWHYLENHVQSVLSTFFENQPFSEFEAVTQVMRQLPNYSVLHTANSMAVRYANMVGFNPNQNDIQIFANRGTSGIDGCTSTAVGHAIANPMRRHFLITGDVAFFYDRNAFWHQYFPKNLHIILLNNGGGGIFRMIDGPDTLPELEPFLETKQTLSAKHLCQEHNISHLTASHKDDFSKVLPLFFNMTNNTCVLEIFTDKKTNKKVFKDFLSQVRTIIEK